ncbi:MAG: hypothetical protein Fur0032_00720 [Terrimicrobiaceae bacterium]
MQVATGLDIQIKESMTRKKVQHVVKESDAGGAIALAGTINPQRELDVGFFCGAMDQGFTAHKGCDSEPEAEQMSIPIPIQPCGQSWLGVPVCQNPFISHRPR